MMEGVSVIVCCYNSGSRIAETLAFLKEQFVPGNVGWELIIVDNASTDNTQEVAKKSWESSSLPPLNLVYEATPGLAAARKAGIRESRYDFILFVDDDNHLEPDYVFRAFDIMISHPEVAIAGGWVKPKFGKQPGKWIEPNYAALAIGDQGMSERYVSWVFGAGMIIRKSLFDEFERRGIKMYLSGRVGKKQTSGDDAEMCQLASFLGYKIFYSPALVLHHKISPHRLTKSFFIKSNYKNVFMVVYFHILDALIRSSDAKEKQLYRSFFWKRLMNVVYYLPRALFGKNAFFSFMMLFQNAQLVAWLMIRRREFEKTYNLVRLNLYHEN